jgi:tetratricopeptide (TPR) repeat protein
MWFHLASGKVFTEKGIIHYDVLSQAGVTRSLVPYEWLFDTILYRFISLFGFSSYKIFVGGIAIIHIGIFYLLLRKIFQTPVISSIGVSVFYFLLVSSFFVGRPQIIADTFFLIEIYVTLLFLVKNKNVLYLLLPVAYIWGNFHPSIVLGLAYLLAQIVITACMFIQTKELRWLHTTKILSLFFIGMCILSILPPEGIMGYQYIFIIGKYAHVFYQNIIEWFPLTRLFADGMLYIFFTLPFFCMSCYLIYKKKLYHVLIWMIPILFLIPYGFTALRNTFFGYLGISILVGWLLSRISFRRYSLRLFVGLGGVVIYIILIWATINRISSISIAYPEKAVAFLKQYTFEGNMFNDYNYGGYLAYQLYPRYKVFVDGRTDLFLCCELPGYFSLQQKITLPDKEFGRLVTEYFSKYKISYAVLELKGDDLGVRISQILVQDPNWVLVYWDDGHDIFVRKGTNKSIVTTFGTIAVSPFSPSPVKDSQMQQAYHEYARMTAYADSAVSRNALGYILFLQGKMPEAKEQFQKAIQLDGMYESGYSNLAEVMVREKNYPQAIILYAKALSLNQNRPILYIRLGQLYAAQQDMANARDIWRKGLDHTNSENYKQIFNQYLQSLSY